MKEKTKSRLKTFIAIAFIVYFLYAIISQQPRLDDLSAQLNKLQKEMEEEEIIKKELEYHLSIIDTDEYIEYVARERLGYVKANDLVFISSKEK